MKTLCEEILSVLNVIDPGYNRDRGVILRHLSEVSKLLWRRRFGEGQIAQEVFTRRVAECMILFEESQKPPAVKETRRRSQRPPRSRRR